MDEKPNEIMNHIESQRHQLGRNLDELEARVKRTADWRAQFDRNPMLMIGVALGGGVLLGSIVNGAVRRSSPISSTSTSDADLGTGSSYGYDDSVRSTSGSTTSSAPVNSAISPARGEVKGKVTDTLEQIKGALIAFATAKVKDFMAEALPGFGEHLEHAERQYLAGRGTARDYSGQYSSGDFQRPGSSGSQSSGTGSQRTEYSSQTPYRQ